MELLEKSIKRLTFLAVAATICLPAGIVCIILGALKGAWAVLGIGIAMAVFGFYGTPLLWVGYGSKKTMKRLVIAVEQDNLYDVRSIAEMLDLRVKEADGKIKEALKKRYIVGYLYENGELKLNTKEKQKRPTVTMSCDSCGAKFVIDPTKTQNECPYCGTTYGNDPRKYGKENE